MTMQPVKVDFEKRVEEIETFFNHLQSVEAKKESESAGARRPQARTNDLAELEKILKANLFLLLYNLVESTVRQSLEAICDAVASEELSYSDFREQIQQLWIKTKHKNFQDLGTASIFSALQALPTEIVELAFEQKLAAGGNLDARKIREFADQYGFSAAPHYRAKDGAALYLIKKRRNDLAHGLESFAECGRQYSIPELESMKREAIVYLRSIIRNITRYVNDKRYRNSSGGAA